MISLDILRPSRIYGQKAHAYVIRETGQTKDRVVTTAATKVVNTGLNIANVGLESLYLPEVERCMCTFGRCVQSAV